MSANQGLTLRGDDHSDIQIQQLIPPTQIPALDQVISQAEVTSIDLDKELREHLRSLPTKNDIQLLISAVELSCKQMVDGLREDTIALGHRVEEMEISQDDIKQAVADTQEAVKNHEEKLNSLLDQMDDQENRDRRQNIRIQGLAEVKGAMDLFQTVTGLFRQILGPQAPDVIKIDRVHRSLSYVHQNTDRPRDIVCKLHKFTMKEAIMKAARNNPRIEHEDCQIPLFPDLIEH